MKGTKKFYFQKGRSFTTKTDNISNNDNLARDFADYCLALGNSQEAALKIGVEPEKALAEGIRLMASPEVRRYITKRKRNGTAKIEALAGLRRLAFGRINDALELLKDDPAEVRSERLDLFNVSEIKRVKGGGVEIKFFDRLEALEKLAELEDKAADSAAADSFFSAIQKSARQGD